MAVWSITNVKEINKSHRIDSEYFQPFYLEAEEKVLTAQNKKLGQIGQFLIGPFGSAFHVSNYDSTSPYRYIRGKDVKPFSLLDEDSVFMPEKDFKRLEKYAVMPEDLLISVVGTLGNVAIVPSNVKGIFSCKSTVFRNSTVDPFYLLAYFNSTYGRNCLLRRQRGAIQTGLNKDDLKTIPIPIFEYEMAIGNLVRESLHKRNESMQLYAQAQQLLEDELGLNDIVLEKPKSYVSSFNEIVETNRFDSEHYQTQYQQIRDKIKNYKNGHVKLLELVQAIKPNYNPKKEPAKRFNYVELSNINSTLGIIEGCKNITGLQAPSRAKRIIETGDIIASSVVGSVEKSGIVSREDCASLASTGFFQFRSKGSSPYYLLVLFKSLIFKKQLQQEATGGILSAVPDQNLKKIILPNIPMELQNRIATMAMQSHLVRKESAQLLEQAKKRVEELIERGARA